MKHTQFILFFYLMRQYTVSILGLFLILILVMGLFDSIESLRILSKVGQARFSMILYLVGLKVPANVLIISTFVILFSGMMVMANLQKRQEFLVMRTSGASLWQILRPFFLVSFLFGLLLVMGVHPLSTKTEHLYDQYEQQMLKKGSSTVSLLERGLWLRQEQSDGQGGSYILHAERVALPDWTLSRVMVLYFNKNHQFIARADSDQAYLLKDSWQLKDPVVLGQSGEVRSDLGSQNLKTSLTQADLNNSFLSSHAVSFWSMPRFIKTLQETGFPTLPLQVKFGGLLMLPFLCVALVMIAAIVSIRPVRTGAAARQIFVGVFAGFFIFFLNSFLQALGASGQIPVWLAVTAPVLLTASVGGIAILSFEDR